MKSIYNDNSNIPENQVGSWWVMVKKKTEGNIRTRLFFYVGCPETNVYGWLINEI